jgi:heme/copper-type cytochrome/quinol oxidase subunit 2
MALFTKRWFFLILAGLAGAVIVFAPLPVRVVPPAKRTLRIEANQFAYSPAELTVNPGDTVTIELVSTDVVHGLYVDGYGVSVTADPGQTARLTFTADRPGSFRFRCNVTCGALHPFMIGRLQVGAKATLWRAIALTLLAVISGIALFPRPVKYPTT